MLSELLHAVLHFLCFCVSLDHFGFVVSKLVLFSFSCIKPRAWLGRTSPKWPILCQVGCKTLLHPLGLGLLVEAAYWPLVLKIRLISYVWMLIRRCSNRSRPWRCGVWFDNLMHPTDGRVVRGVVMGWTPVAMSSASGEGNPSRYFTPLHFLSVVHPTF